MLDWTLLNIMENIGNENVDLVDPNTDNDDFLSSSLDGDTEESSNYNDLKMSSDSDGKISFFFVFKVLCRSYFYPK